MKPRQQQQQQQLSTLSLSLSFSLAAPFVCSLPSILFVVLAAEKRKKEKPREKNGAFFYLFRPVGGRGSHDADGSGKGAVAATGGVEQRRRRRRRSESRSDRRRGADGASGAEGRGPVCVRVLEKFQRRRRLRVFPLAKNERKKRPIAQLLPPCSFLLSPSAPSITALSSRKLT